MSVKFSIEYYDSIIKNIAETEGFKHYRLQIRRGSSKGDGSLGIITAVSIISSTKKMELMLKIAETDKELRKQFPIRKAYLREIYVYEEIFPYFDKFQKDKNFLDGFNGYAKVFGSCRKENNENIVLENLKESGYTMWNRKIPMESKHVDLVIREYAKFHSVSLAIRNKEPETYRKITEDMKDIFEDTIPKREVISIIQSIIRDSLEAVTDNNFIKQALIRVSDNAEIFCLENLHCSEDQIVITHGDCWCNNIMFKYEDPFDVKKPTKICLLDWQLSKLGSPVLDVAYFLFVCSSREVLNNYKKYLKIYHDTVIFHLKQLSCDPNIFPFSLLEYHWKKYAKFGLYTALLILKLVLSDTDDIPDLREVAQSGEILSSRLKFASDSTDFRRRILDIVYVMAENELI